MSRLGELARGASTGIVHRIIPLPNPDAGAGLTIAPDAGRAWEVLSVLCPITVDETDGSRLGQLAYLAGDTIAWIIGSSDTVAPDGTGSFEWLADWSWSQAGDTGPPIAVAMPHTILLPGYSLAVNVANIAPADQISGAVAQVLEVSTGEREHDRTIANNLRGRADAIADLLSGDV